MLIHPALSVQSLTNYLILTRSDIFYLTPHFSLNDLNQPIHDVARLQQLLTKQYAFPPKNVNLLKNPDRAAIIKAFDILSQKLKEDDNLLIFYAGQGYWDEKFNQGYWLPSNATKDNRVEWISNSTIRDFIRGINTKHTLLISDACFSGSLLITREVKVKATPAIQNFIDFPVAKL